MIKHDFIPALGIVAILWIFIPLAPVHAAEITTTKGDIYTITKVTDGDSLRAGDIRIRLHGIDAPEMRQTCLNETPYSCGVSAKDYLVAALGDKPSLRCEHLDTDRYQRKVMRCYHRGVDISAGMVRAGWALAYRRYASDYIADEQEAKAANRGLWAGRFEMPWKWRRDN